MHADEVTLITRSIAQDADAYGQLVERYQRAIYYHCIAIVGDEVIAEDVAQETFIKAYYHLSQYDQSRKFSTWLFKIATNTALNVLKQSKSTIFLDDDQLVNVVSTHTPVETQGQHAELYDAVMRLEPRYRAVVSLYYWQGLSYAEVASAMSVPIGSVRGWMSRAKEHLRKELA